MGASNSGKSPNSMFPIFATFDYSFKNIVVCGLAEIQKTKLILFNRSMAGEIEKRPVWLVLMAILLSAFIGTLVGAGIGSLVGSLFYTDKGDFMMAAATSQYTPEMKVPILVMQGITSFFGLLLAPFLTFKALTQNGIKSFSNQKLKSSLLLLCFFIMLAFIVVDSAVIEWNKNIVFPDFLKSFETWARSYEERLEALTKMFTQFTSFGDFAVAMIVVGVGAGVCEEFLFRGIIQNELMRGTKNIHLSIWVAAFLFSAIHMQFFGFVPRMLLGGLFGYLYHWSGNLLVPMFAHFVNNGFAVLMMYLHQLKIVNMDLEKEEAAPWYAVIVFAVIAASLLFLFKRKSEEPKTAFS
jgi:membrane protease YdiL (CAAX protease family)